MPSVRRAESRVWPVRALKGRERKRRKRPNEREREREIGPELGDCCCRTGAMSSLSSLTANRGSGQLLQWQIRPTPTPAPVPALQMEMETTRLYAATFIQPSAIFVVRLYRKGGHKRAFAGTQSKNSPRVAPVGSCGREENFPAQEATSGRSWGGSIQHVQALEDVPR